MNRLTKKEINDPRIFKISNYIKNRMKEIEYQLTDKMRGNFYKPEGYENYSIKLYSDEKIEIAILISPDGENIILAPVVNYNFLEEFLADALELFNIN